MGTAERRLRERNARRDTVLASARELFNGKGFDKTTVDDIVEKAEVSKGTFYNYFPSKVEIIGVLLLQNIQSALSRIEEVARSVQSDNGGTPTTQELLSILSGAFMRFVLEEIENQGIFTILQGDFRAENLSKELRDDLAMNIDRVFRYFDLIIQRGIAEGVFRKNLNARKLALIVWGATIGIHTLSVKLGPQVISESMEEVFDEILNLVPRGLVE